MKVTINSQVKLGSTLLDTPDERAVKNEPMLFRAQPEFAYRNGGPLTEYFLDTLSQDWQIDERVLIDSRVHMLMPGMWPCIPGWHHDDVPRTRSDGQPEYITPEYKAQHCMLLFGDCSLTEFATGCTQFDLPPVGEKIYKTWDPEVERQCNIGALNRVRVQPGRLTFFDWNTWHRGMPTTHTGFRFFIRATRYSKLAARNELRANANVYMPVINEGW